MPTEELQPGERYWRLVEPVWKSISIYDGPDVFLSQFQRVSPPVGHLFAGHWCQSEVCNGGLHQFFSNPTGVLAPDAAIAYEVIGIPEWAAVMREAIEYFKPSYPRDQDERIQILDSVIRPGSRREEWDPFTNLDRRFYAWYQGDYDRWCRIADDYAARNGG